MKLTINGQPEEFSNPAITITELLKLKSVEMPEMVSVEHNGTILNRSDFDATPVKDGDDIEFLYFMGGGGFFTNEI